MTFNSIPSCKVNVTSESFQSPRLPPYTLLFPADLLQLVSLRQSWVLTSGVSRISSRGQILFIPFRPLPLSFPLPFLPIHPLPLSFLFSPFPPFPCFLGIWGRIQSGRRSAVSPAEKFWNLTCDLVYSTTFCRRTRRICECPLLTFVWINEFCMYKKLSASRRS